MHEGEGLIYAYLLDGRGSGKSMGWDEIRNWTPEMGVIWIHLNYSFPDAEDWIKNESGLPEIISDALLEPETRPRSVTLLNGLLITLRGVNLQPQSDPEDMVSIRLWVDQNRIISTRQRRILSMNDLRIALESGEGPKTQGEFVVSLSDRLIEKIANVIGDIDDEVDGLQEQVLTMESHQLRPLISGVRRQAIALRRYLSPQREALTKLYNEKAAWLTDINRMNLREASDRMIRSIEDLDSARERAGVTQEELLSRLSENMEKRMYIISLVSTVFLPLSFLTGLLGINVGGIPGAESKIAFTLVCLFLATLAGLQFWFFRKKSWV